MGSLGYLQKNKKLNYYIFYKYHSLRVILKKYQTQKNFFSKFFILNISFKTDYDLTSPLSKIEIGDIESKIFENAEKIYKDAATLCQEKITMSESEYEKFLKKLNSMVLFYQNDNITEMSKNFLGEIIRLYVLVFSEKICELPEKSLAKFNTNLKKISEKVGTIPVLNTNVKQADKQFLPEKYEKSADKWSKILWKNKKKIRFYKKKVTGHEYASVRLQLSQTHFLREEKASKNKLEGLCHVTFRFRPIGDLHADHFQPSSNIFSKLNEMIKAMNVSKKFCNKIIKMSKKGYFLVEKDVVYGTKLLFMDYYNCIDNLWLISASENSGIGKGKAKAVDWINSNQIYGEPCLEYLGKIDKSKILETCNIDGKELLLCDAVKRWFSKKYKTVINTSKYTLLDIVEPIESLAKKIIETESKASKIWLGIKMGMMGSLLTIETPESIKTKQKRIPTKRIDEISKDVASEINRSPGIQKNLIKIASNIFSRIGEDSEDSDEYSSESSSSWSP